MAAHVCAQANVMAIEMARARRIALRDQYTGIAEKATTDSGRAAYAELGRFGPGMSGAAIGDATHRRIQPLIGFPSRSWLHPSMMLLETDLHANCGSR